MNSNYINWILSLILAFLCVYIVGYVNWENQKKGIEIIPLNDFEEIKNKILPIAEYSMQIGDFRTLDLEFNPYKNRLYLIIVAVNSSKSYESHANNRIIIPRKELFSKSYSYNFKLYDLYFNSIEFRSWNGEYKSWVKYLFDTLTRKNHYRFYLTKWLLISFGIWLGLFYSISHYGKTRNRH
ncbi:MAG: hypothetical protein SH817_04730 [Leptospira sp.]|nr:hypothetical protein [Leptospira sp.]